MQAISKCAWVAGAILGLGWTALGQKCPGACDRVRTSNIHYSCASPGAACDGAGCNCRKVQGGIWSDCYCVKIGTVEGGKWCDSGGKWRVLCSSPLVPGNPNIVCTFTPAPGNEFEVYDAAHVAPDGTIVSSQIFNGPTDLQGQFVLRVLNGPPDQIPIEIVSLNLVSTSVIIGGQPSGPNTIMMPAGPAPLGTWNANTGTILFNEPIPIVVFNALIPGGANGFMQPIMEVPPGFGATEMDVMPLGGVRIFGFAPIPAISPVGLVMLCVLVLCLGGVIIGRRIMMFG